MLVIGLIWSAGAYAQESAYIGKWKGAAKVPRGIISVALELSLDEEGNHVGVFYSKSVPVKDSSAYTVKGNTKKGLLTLYGKKFIYRKGTSCLAKLVLSYDLQGNSEFINGKWKPQLVVGGCIPGFSGEMSFEKVKESQAVAAAIQAPVLTPSDDVGRLLKERLESTNFYALIIGVNNYPSEGLTPLDRPESDADALAQTLTTYYGFESTNIEVLKSPSRDGIIQAFENLSSKTKEKDNVLIFYAGHGVWLEELHQGYWLPSDASLTSRSNWLSNGTIRDLIRSLKSKHTLLIADACFSGAMLKERAVMMNSKAVLEMYKRTSRKAITSGTLETVPDKSVFFKYLNKRLKEQDGLFLTAGELFNSFKIAVINNSPNSQLPQYGAISQSGDEGGDFIFLRTD